MLGRGNEGRALGVEPWSRGKPLMSNINGSVPLIFERVFFPSMSRTMSWGTWKGI